MKHLCYASDMIEAEALRDYLNTELVWCDRWNAEITEVEGTFKTRIEINMPDSAMEYKTSVAKTRDTCRDFRDGFKAARKLFEKDSK